MILGNLYDCTSQGIMSTITDDDDLNIILGHIYKYYYYLALPAPKSTGRRVVFDQQSKVHNRISCRRHRTDIVMNVYFIHSVLNLFQLLVWQAETTILLERENHVRVGSRLLSFFKQVSRVKYQNAKFGSKCVTSTYRNTWVTSILISKTIKKYAKIGKNIWIQSYLARISAQFQACITYYFYIITSATRCTHTTWP